MRIFCFVNSRTKNTVILFRSTYIKWIGFNNQIKIRNTGQTLSSSAMLFNEWSCTKEGRVVINENIERSRHLSLLVKYSTIQT